LKVGIYNTKSPNGHELIENKYYKSILLHNNIPFVQLNVEQPDFWDSLKELSLFIMRFQQIDTNLQLATDILPIAEREYGVNCYPNQVTSWHYDDKVKQYYLMRAHGFPMTESWVFYDMQSALNWAKQTTYPIIFKLRGGAGSMNVIRLESVQQANKIIKKMFGQGVYPESFMAPGLIRFQKFSILREVRHFGGNLYRWSRGLDISPYWRKHKNYVYFQKFLPNNNHDTRVTVIGGRAFAFRRLVRENDFRASGSGKIDYDTSEIDLRCVKLAFEISSILGFQCMAYDFLTNESGGIEFCEISYTFLSGAIHECPGYWDRSLDWHEGHYWPEHLHLVDALDLPDLKCPRQLDQI
jgi:glutathione synthase/RimK-type ligase-like ATP-grasp enzyme